MNAQVDQSDNGELHDQDEDADYINDSESDYSASSATSITIDPQAQLLEDLQSSLNSLTLEAETILSHQPRHTQLVLAGETKRLFKAYEQYGSMARLKVGIEKFLRQGDEKGRIKIEDETKDKDPKSLSHKKKRPAHYGEAFMHNHTADDDEQKFDPHTAFITPYRRDPFNPDPSAFISHPLRTIDIDSIPYVTTLPWDPLATKIIWPANLRWPRGVLSSFNKILSIVDAESQVRLFHHVTKWGPSPVFRAGIAQHVKSQYATLFETAQEHYLGLTPETRSFLRDIYFKNQYINIAERRLLALACRIHEYSVQIFWEDMASSLRGYEAMRTFMAAREIEKNREFRKKMEAEQETKRREEVLRKHTERFNALKATGRADPNSLGFFQVDGKANM